MRSWHGFLILMGLAGFAGNAIAAPQIDGGEGFSCALGSSGRAFCWGFNTSGQTGTGLGLPFQSSVSRPTEMAASFVTVTNGGFHSCGLQADGTAWCWGRNYWGQLGNGKAGGNEDLPVRVLAPEKFKSISAGGEHTCAIDEFDEAWCWGSNFTSQLGKNKSLVPISEVPVLVNAGFPGGNIQYRSISAGAGHTCAIDFAGIAWCWGTNANARAGIDINICGGGTTTLCEFFVPRMTQASAGGLRFNAISAGGFNTCAIDTGGTVQCWGNRFRGSTLVGSPDQPAAVPHVWPAVSVSAGNESVCAVTGGGELFCWGKNDQGQLGDGSPVSSTAQSIAPVRVLGLQDYASVSVGGGHACGRTTGGWARCWGNNGDGQLGTNVPTVTLVNSPAGVTGLDTRLVTSGFMHTCSLDSAGVVACWGKNVDGQIGHGRRSTNPRTQTIVPTPVARFFGILRRSGIFPPNQSPPEVLSNTMPSDIKWDVGTVRFNDLAVGGQHVCGLAPTGLAYCWGADFLGQVGNGKTTSIQCRYGGETASTCVPLPTVVSRGEGHLFVDLTAGASGTHTCGRNAGGIIFCWGSARYGELGSTGPTQSGPSGSFQRVPTQIEVPFPYRANMLDVSAGDASTCAVDGGTVFCWGAINWSPTPAPMKFPSGPNYVRVGTGALHACAGFPNGAMDCIGDNTFGQLADGTNNYAHNAILAANGFPYEPFDASWSFMCGIEIFANDVDCWGGNFNGELGDGSTSASNLPVRAKLPAGFGAVHVGTGFDHTCAINGKGQAQCWGSNAFSQVGDPVSLGNKAVTAPALVAAGWFVP